jgi:hypothetical protein
MAHICNALPPDHPYYPIAINYHDVLEAMEYGA